MSDVYFKEEGIEFVYYASLSMFTTI